jgi:hypothetical protein
MNGRCVACFMEDNLPDQILIKSGVYCVNGVISFHGFSHKQKNAVKIADRNTRKDIKLYSL